MIFSVFNLKFYAIVYQIKNGNNIFQEILIMPNDWENPAITHFRRLDARSILIPFEEREEALLYDKSSSGCCRTLNGMWQFRLFSDPESVPGDVSAGITDDSWAEIPMPSHWQMQGYGYPHYTNTQ